MLPRARVAMAMLLASSAACGAEPIEEVVVSGARLEELRAEVIRLEDAFNARYNELNTVRDFDIRCAEEAATGTRLRRRVCRPVFADEAEGQHARDFVGVLNSGGSSSSAQLAIAMRNAEFRKNLDAITRRDAALAKLLEQRAKAQAKLDAARRDAFKQKAPAPE